ncbi:hypothetical protein DL762_009939 [Monosporascus cannonballus]|uniref:Inositol-pentakisphosphate 2-kinase n=1 Tax=Monosporascus cannonballus TaxID=155416 RepID=A0ABY0GSP2_9PEZI|nr:hypothetical protein DL762_009939 [Monosporascus cannonballus]
MEAIWEKLSRPLPASGSDAESIITPEMRQRLVDALDKYDFEYVAEGRANVVFGIRDPPGEGDHPTVPRGQFGATLLRVPKATPGVTPCGYKTLQRFHEDLVERRVGREHLVPQVLVAISRGLAERLNAARTNANGGRGRGRKKDGGGDGHDGDGDGNDSRSVIRPGAAMLIQDMGPAPGYRAFEFKPKWLAQSPLAPPGAARCRTCAREAFRNSQKLKKDPAVEVPPPTCPLGLVHDDPAVVAAPVERLVPADWSRRDRERLAAALRAPGSNVLDRLRDLQVEGDAPPGQALFDSPGDPGFGLAMTLRDCSCFVRLPVDEDDDAPVVIKLADVDKKNWQEKQTYGQESHRRLVDQGFYGGKEDPPMETHCVLGSNRHT